MRKRARRLFWLDPEPHRRLLGHRRLDHLGLRAVLRRRLRVPQPPSAPEVRRRRRRGVILVDAGCCSPGYPAGGRWPLPPVRSLTAVSARRSRYGGAEASPRSGPVFPVDEVTREHSSLRIDVADDVAHRVTHGRSIRRGDQAELDALFNPAAVLPLVPQVGSDDQVDREVGAVEPDWRSAPRPFEVHVVADEVAATGAPEEPTEYHSNRARARGHR